jgi:nucleoside-diphosphate-sugar epimerase
MNSNYFADKSVLVVGATGYIGGKLYKALEPKCKELIGWGRPNLWRAMDLSDVDIIYYVGSQTDARWAEDNIDQDLLLNASPFLALAQAASQAKIIFAAAATQVGYTDASLPSVEFRYDDPISIYDIHKYLIELYLKYFSTQGRACVSLRLTNVYGPGNQRDSTGRGILNKMIRSAVEEKQITVYGDKKRDFIFVDDAVRAFLMIASVDPVNDYLDVTRGVYLLGSGRTNTFIGAAKMIKKEVKELLNYNIKLNIVKPPQDDPLINQREFRASTLKIQIVANWRPYVSFQEGIRRTIEWMVA